MIKPNSIVSWLEHEFGDISHSGSDMRVNCPFCPEPDTKQHLYVNTVKPVAHCFRCDWVGTHFKLVMEVVGAESYAEVINILSGSGSRAKLDEYKPIADRLKALFNEEQSRPALQIVQMPDWFVSYDRNEYGNNAHANVVLKYALSRLSVNDVIRHGVGYCDDISEQMLRWRVVFPVERGFWQARSIGNGSGAKYVSPKMGKGDILFNYGAIYKHREIFVAEGIISAIALGSNAVAVLGKRATEAQADRIAIQRQIDKITIAFDADTEFSKSVTELADTLAGHGKDIVIRQYAEGDPDSCELYTEKPYSMKYKVFAGLFA